MGRSGPVGGIGPAVGLPNDVARAGAVSRPPRDPAQCLSDDGLVPPDQQLPQGRRSQDASRACCRQKFRVQGQPSDAYFQPLSDT